MQYEKFIFYNSFYNQKIKIQHFSNLKQIDCQNQNPIPIKQLKKLNMSSSSFTPQSQHFQTTQQQQFQTILKSILPQIQKQLLKDIQLQLQNEFEQKYLAKLQEINKQAQKQYEFAIKQLDQSSKLLQQEKGQEINKELMNLEQVYEMIQQQRLIRIQQRFLEQNFQERIMAHTKIIDLEKDIQEQIYSLLQQKHELTKQRQLKELIIGNQTKQIKIRKQLDQQIKSKIYNSSGLEELKQEINQSKIQMGSQKSEYNLKLKKVQQEIKEFQDKIKAIEKMGDLQEMRIRHNELRIQLVEKQEQEVFRNEESSNQTKRITKLQKQHEQMEKQIKIQKNMRQKKSKQKRNDDSLEKSQQDQFYSEKRHLNNKNNAFNKNNFEQKNQTQQKTLKRQPKNQSFALTGREDPNKNQNYQQNEQDPSEQQSQCHYNNQNHNIQQNYSSQQSQNTKKFDLTSYFKKYLISSQTAKITESQNVVVSQNEQTNRMNSKDSCSLLNLENISQMLKQKIKIDPLQRYLNKQSIAKQNNVNSQNVRIPTGQKSSNFAQLYEQHLKNLNKGLAKKYQKGKVPPTEASKHSSNGLSQMAKKSIIKNLSKYHKQAFGSTKSNMDQVPIHESKPTSVIYSNISKQPTNNNMIKSFTFAKYINSSRGTMQEYPPQQSNLLASFK